MIFDPRCARAAVCAVAAPEGTRVPDYLLAIDQGTTSTRAILFDAGLVPVATAQQEFAQIYPAPGLVEHDPEAIWSSTVAAVRRSCQTMALWMGRPVARSHTMVVSR